MITITPFLWFADQAEEAAEYYCSIFTPSKIVSTSRYGDTGPGPKGSAMVVEIEIASQRVMILNGGPHFPQSEAFSFMVQCETQEEIDRYWNKLVDDGGKPSQCGWLKDKFGLSWQIVPRKLIELILSGDERSNRVMRAMMKMVKLDLHALENA